jgi:hypothetical protein
MQQPTGVVDMMTASNQQTRSQVSCEKITLFRHAILLPKNVHSYLSRSSVGHSITMLTPILIGIAVKRANKALYSPDYR